LKIESKISRKRMKLFQDTRETSPSPPSLSTCGNTWGWNARGHVGGDPRPRQRSGAYARLDPSRQCQSRAHTAGFSLLEERNITCPNDMKKRGLGWRGDCLCFHYSLLLPAWPAWLFIFYVYFHIWRQLECQRNLFGVCV